MKKLLIATLLYLSSTSIFADDSYFVGEILLGSTEQEVSGDSDKDTSLGLRGTYNINPNIGIELSYQNYGEGEWASPNGYGGTINEKTASSSLNLGIKGMLPLQNDFSLNARLGIAFWSVDVDIIDSASPGINIGGNDSSNDIYIGFGGQYAVNNKFIIGIEYVFSEYGVSFDGNTPYGPLAISADLRIKSLAFTAGLKF